MATSVSPRSKPSSRTRDPFGNGTLRNRAALPATSTEWRGRSPTYRSSKKLENHAAMVSLYFLSYNFARVHQTLRVTPAMEAGIADHVCSIDEIVGLLG